MWVGSGYFFDSMQRQSFSPVCKDSHVRQYAKINRPELKKIRQYAETALFANTQLPQILRLEKETKK